MKPSIVCLPRPPLLALSVKTCPVSWQTCVMEPTSLSSLPYHCIVLQWKEWSISWIVQSHRLSAFFFHCSKACQGEKHDYTACAWSVHVHVKGGNRFASMEQCTKGVTPYSMLCFLAVACTFLNTPDSSWTLSILNMSHARKGYLNIALLAWHMVPEGTRNQKVPEGTRGYQWVVLHCTVKNYLHLYNQPCNHIKALNRSHRGFYNSKRKPEKRKEVLRELSFFAERQHHRLPSCISSVLKYTRKSLTVMSH